ncbi:MAG: UDP-N-acetylmuramoyl-L-alanine--D-glutamate ligase [Candidatus Marinimicrobia bacterium]|nr:UDP-N-acetylmuramoyl-L-alanine--D-glutamate ligase [Candidatus Neomarinimicrobiota bacterium]
MDISNKNYINIAGKNISIIGLGRSGVSAAKLAHHHGANVFISDANDSELNRHFLNELNRLNIAGESGTHSDRIFDADLMIISPGVPKESSIVKKAIEVGIPVVGEIEFAYWFSQYPIIGVTGSNGKTTTVNILGKIFQTDTIHGSICGNVGIPFSQEVLADTINPDAKRVYILEISSFQMEFILHFHPNFSLFLNITPDHLDRHGSLKNYIDCKLNMAKNQTDQDTVIFNQNDFELQQAFQNHKAKTIPFSTIHQSGLFRMNETKIYGPNHESFIGLDQIKIPGQHNIENIIAASTLSFEFGISLSHISKVISNFSGVEHRLEYVAEIEGVTYINDSKATNLESVIVALSSFNQPIILILGGRNKGADFHNLLPHTQVNQVKQVITYGEARHEITESFGDAVRSESILDLRDAVVTAKNLASPGDVILLSPGCASFDQFDHFEERGNMFKKWVNELDLVI